MRDPDERCPILLDGLPPRLFEEAVGYLDDALRECQLVLVAESQGHVTDEDLGRVARALVPDIEAMRDAFVEAESSLNGDGTVRLAGSLLCGQASMVVHLQVQLVHLRDLERRGDLLLESDPQASQLLTWVWDAVADQLAGRPARPFRAAS